MQSALPATYVRVEPRTVPLILELIDRLIALALLLITAPLIVAASASVLCLSRQIPFILHRRVGRWRTPFSVIKIRTMWTIGHTPHLSPEHKSPDDPRVSSGFARFLRRHSIDELPQLVQVVTGQMSLVGPRPLTQKELIHYYGDSEREITAVRPGLSGVWQVRGRGRLTYGQRRRLDLFLVRHYCAGLYFRVLLETIGCVITGRDAW